MTSRRFDVLIVGSGHAGAQAAAALRQRRFEGSVAIVGEELELPYERPPLSKDYLAGEKPFERILIRPARFWEERDVTLLAGRRVVEVRASDREVVTEDGERIGYGDLVWAAGGHPRRLTCAGHDLAGVHAVRSRANVDKLVGELPSAWHVCVVGGGYIGLEAAAVLTKLGKSVTVLEAQERVLARVAGEALSRAYEAEHRAHGVELRLGAFVDSIEGKDGKACALRLADGEAIPCQIVIVGIGIVPSVLPLIKAGADGTNGLSVDQFCRTSLPHVFAIGDCAEHPNVHAGGRMVRLESVQNANDQATTVADFLTGEAVPYAAVPWFWSNQYDLRLQTVGLSIGHDREVLRGDPANRSYSVIYLKEGRVIALDCVNAVKDFVQGKLLVADGSVIDPTQLADPTIPLKLLAAEGTQPSRLVPVERAAE